MDIGGVLPTLASPDDIVDRLGRNLNQVEAARIDGMLRDGSAILRRYCRNDFVYRTNDTITIIADAGILKLPCRPVYSIESVVWRSGYPAIQDFPITWYVFDGIDQITIPEPRHSGVINLPYMWYQAAWYSDSFDVTHTYGYQNVPGEVIAVLCTAIISELATPTMSATLASESIGAYSYAMRRTSGAGLRAALIDAGMEDTLNDFRQKQGTLALRF